jgi:CBS domain containing-hemolysin-like protein
MLGGIVILFLFSTLLALSETAFTRTNRIRAIALEEEGKPGAARLVVMLQHPERTLNSLLFLLLLSQLTSASLLGVVLERQAGSWGLAIGITLQILVYYVLGEVAPKTYAIQHPERAALRVSGFLYAITNFWPLRKMSRGLIGLANVLLPGKGLKEGPFVTEQDLRMMADVAADDSEIDHDERELIHSIFEFGDTVVREVMTPRPDMIGIEVESTLEAALNTAINEGLSRLPVYEGTTDEVVGIIYLKDLIRRSRSGDTPTTIREMLRPAKFVPEQQKVAKLLKDMRTERFHMAMVVDEHGGTAGLVTLEDLIEEIVGDITDEYDAVEPSLERLEGGGIRAPGNTPIDEVGEVLGMELPDEESDTLGGFVFNVLGRVPEQGEEFAYQNFKFRVERIERRRIKSVVIVPILPLVTADEPN